MENRIGVPIVSITRDGTGGAKNRKVIPYLHFAPARGTPWPRAGILKSR